MNLLANGTTFFSMIDQFRVPPIKLALFWLKSTHWAPVKLHWGPFKNLMMMGLIGIKSAAPKNEMKKKRPIPHKKTHLKTLKSMS